MYWEYFGFKEPPFALTPNPAFLFLSSPHQEAFAHLLFAIENRVGFIELSGEVGTGKTTLVRTLLNQLNPDTHRTALIFNPTLSPSALLREINAEFGLPSEAADTRDLHQALNRFLLDENRAGHTVVLVIDEAQNLSVEVLEQLRLISNLETESDKLIQIVLVGQPELNTLLARPELRQLNQRITVRYHLTSMDFADSCDYIRHRIRFAAGGREPLRFSTSAFKKIFAFSGGLPRLINGVCDRAVLLAYTRESHEVSAAMAAASIADLSREGCRPRRRLLPAAAAACVVALIATGALLWMPPQKRESKAPVAKPVARPAAAAPFSASEALKELASAPEQDNLFAAVNAVLGSWQALPVLPVPGQVATVKSLARQRGMVATGISCRLDSLARLDAPALLHVTVPGAGKRLLAVTGYGKGGVAIAPSLGGRATLAEGELERIWHGEATLLWKDFHSLAAAGRPPATAEKVKLLQNLLKTTGCYNGPLNGRTGPKTQAAVAEFQRRERLAVDGQPMGLTLMLLYRRAGGFFPPTLSRAEIPERRTE